MVSDRTPSRSESWLRITKSGLIPTWLPCWRSMSAQKEWKVVSKALSRQSGTSASTRWRISAAALLVKVSPSTRKRLPGESRISLATLIVRTRVFPEPGPARTRRGPSFHSTARRWFALRLSGQESCLNLRSCDRCLNHRL